MSKAFDKVKHQQLILDLFSLGICRTALGWFRSYLSDRHQRVVLADGDKSSTSECQCGVPQGSVLGPLLFVLYTKDVADVTNPALCQQFADDILLATSSTSSQSLNDTLSLSVTNLSQYLDSKGLILNPTKTQVLPIPSCAQVTLDLDVRCRGEPLQHTTVARYLGLSIDSGLRWDAQLDRVVRQSYQKLATLRAIRGSMSERLALLFYTALVLPDLLYASNAYFSSLSSHQRNQLAVLDKRFIRCVANADVISHTTPIYRRLRQAPVLERASCKLRTLIHRIHTGRISESISRRLVRYRPHSHRNLDPHFYIVPVSRRIAGNSRPLVSGAKLWNSLPLEFKELYRPTSFKRLLKVYFYG